MQRRFKTPKEKRNTYIVYDDNGHIVTALVPGKDGITEVLIAELHHMDDEEYDSDRRERDHREKFTPHYSDDGEAAGEAADDHQDHFADPNADIEQLLENQEDVAERQYLLDKLPAAIATLEPKQQELLHLKYRDGLSNTEIAKRRGTSEAAVRNCLNRIYARLGKELKK